MLTHSLITLSNETAIRLSPAGVHSGCDITVQNVNASGYIYVGNSSVSDASYGYRIMPNHAISFELPGKDSLYAVSSAPNMKAAVVITNLESGS
jgi:hypothetical protein